MRIFYINKVEKDFWFILVLDVVNVIRVLCFFIIVEFMGWWVKNLVVYFLIYIEILCLGKYLGKYYLYL